MLIYVSKINIIGASTDIKALLLRSVGSGNGWIMKLFFGFSYQGAILQNFFV